MQPGIQLALGCECTLLAHIQFFIHQYLQVLLCRAALNQLISQSILILGLPWPTCRTLHLALLNFMRFTWARLSSLSQFLWMASLPFRVSATPLSLVSSTNLLRVYSIPLSKSPKKMLNNMSPNKDPSGHHSLGGLHPDIEPLTATLWMPSSSQFLIHQVVHLSNPCLSILEARILCRTISNALHKSRIPGTVWFGSELRSCCHLCCCWWCPAHTQKGKKNAWKFLL